MGFSESHLIENMEQLNTRRKLSMRRLPSRQVHLDFHTSELIPNVGSQFNKKQFQEALIAGHVNSITVFGKCHHGYYYYPTKVGMMHPGLEPDKDLAGEMMEACHEIGVYAPLYLTLGYSEVEARNHPEWIRKTKEGELTGPFHEFYEKPDEVRPEAYWLSLCSAGEYRAYLYEMTKEACDRYERLDGIFFDIVFMHGTCYCEHCLKGMRELGLDPEKIEDAQQYYEMQKKITLEGLNQIIKERHPDASIFYNSGGAEIHMPQYHFASTHFELEDLPTTWGGYDKMPMRARFFAGKDKDYLGMTGKFHRNWGEFGGYKTPEALRYECAAMLANGARISVGDQLHPLGKMDMDTYRNIGIAYSYVEQIEDYCFDTKETAKLGVMVSLERKKNDAIAKLLLDCQIDFDVVHNAADLMRFDTILLPDNYRLNESMGIAFDTFVKQGGKVFMLGGSGLKENADEFAFSVPFTYVGKSKADIDYMELKEKGSEDIPSSPILCYSSAHIVKGEGEVYSHIREPYFNRTYAKFCSHANTPYREEQAGYPGAIRGGNALYVAHELASMYLNTGATYHRRYFKWLLKQLYQAQSVDVEMPSQGRIHFVKREEANQYVLHLMYASPVNRGSVVVLEDFPTLQNTKVKISVLETIEKVTLIPQAKELPFDVEEHGISFMVPEVTGHQIVVLTYSERRRK